MVLHTTPPRTHGNTLYRRQSGSLCRFCAGRGFCCCVHVEVLRVCFVYIVLKIAWYLADTRKTLTVLLVVLVVAITSVATGAVINFVPIGLR